MRIGKIIGVAAASLILLTVGAGLIARGQGMTAADVRRAVRQALGLPKNWVKDFNVAAVGHRQVACPKGNVLVIVTGGQSNASNAYDPAPKPNPDTRAVMYWDGRCYALASPVLGTTSDRDSLWPTLGDEIHRQTGKIPVFINGAVGGVQLGDWLDERSGYMTRLAAQVRAARDRGYAPDLVIWIQGETDSSTLIAPEDYVRQQDEVVRRFAAAGAITPRTAWLINRSTRCLRRRNNGPQIDAALLAYTEQPGDRVYTGPNMSAYDDSFRRDTCHLNTRGRDRLVQETVAALQANRLLPTASVATPSR